MKYILAFVLTCIVATAAMCQNDSGIFLSIKCAKRSPKQTVKISNKQICLAPSPIIFTSEFTSITDVRTVGDKVSFDLTLSAKSVQTLMKLSANLPKSTFALVIDKEIYYEFPASDLTINRTFRFMGNDKESNILIMLQKKLKLIIDQRAQ
jgi:hypothetical protein